MQSVRSHRRDEVVAKLSRVGINSEVDKFGRTTVTALLASGALGVRGAMRTAGAPLWTLAAGAVGVALILVIAPLGALTWWHRGRYVSAIREIEAIFTTHRVTRTEWEEAKRLMRVARASNLLEFGVERRFDELCLPIHQ